MSTQSTQTPALEAQWEDVRLRFFNSLLADTSIHSLVQNLEMSEIWPIEGSNEVPSKYIDFSWEEVNEVPGIADHPERLALLITVLEETIAFDDPFGDMVATVENATDRDNALERILEDLKIPTDCPLRFSALSEETLSFCEGEGVTTIGDFVYFAERMAQSVIVGGDFKATLNALVAKDEFILARFLPYRPNEKGVHLVEAIGLMIAQLSEGERQSLLKRYGFKRPGCKFERATLDREEIATLERQLEDGVRDRADYFKVEMQAALVQIGAGICLERGFIVLDNEELEFVSSALLARVLKRGLDAQPPVEEASPARRGFFAWLFARA